MLPHTQTPRFLLISLTPHLKDRQVVKSEVDETCALITTYGGEVIMKLSQQESHLSQSTYIGRGKAEEISYLVRDHGIDVVVINANLLAGQLFNLKRIFQESSPNVEVWDRTTLILQIFSHHATTAEAKLQIRLAETRHKGPELQGMGKQMSQQGAGIGTRGIGETQTEIMKRHWRSEIKQIESELEKLTDSRRHQMEHRKRLRLPTISIVGYTNAGKSTLFNVLTRKATLVEDAPFATLDSSVSKLYLHGLRKEAFITDTIGFIQNLPPDLVDAFSSTLLETVNADILLHVIDVADPFYPEKVATVEEILSTLQVDAKKRIYVFNKIDSETIPNKVELMHDIRNRFADYPVLFMSALTGQGIEELITTIEHEVIR